MWKTQHGNAINFVVSNFTYGVINRASKSFNFIATFYKGNGE